MPGEEKHGFSVTAMLSDLFWRSPCRSISWLAGGFEVGRSTINHRVLGTELFRKTCREIEMSDIMRHYDDFLAPHYSWMVDLSLTDKIAEQQSLPAMLGLPGAVRGFAVDLGSGPGYQSFALANMGYEAVITIDTSRFLLDELEAARGPAPVKAVHADLRAFSKFVTPSGADAIVCMGDTLTHLETRADVTKLFQDAFEHLAPEGRVVLTFRDLLTELKGLDRFLPIRADDGRIMTCVLDFEPDTVVVNDLVHVRDGQTWTFQKSRPRLWL
ncbi:methyltransferase domain-containing protein [Methylocystis parvus]|uniref:methyltransferase domain-containing protein n=1 Tax=Methylocystis parvus TaxID=134 RepID=UPI003C71BB6D